MAQNQSKKTEQTLIGTNPEEVVSAVTDDERPPTEGEYQAAENAAQFEGAAHIVHGLKDVAPSVQRRFAEHAGTIERRAPKDPPYDGPFEVLHNFRYLDEKGGEQFMSYLMPTPSGEYVRRILEKGDIPSALAQFMWADGVIRPIEPPRPQPRMRPRAIPLPRAELLHNPVK